MFNLKLRHSVLSHYIKLSLRIVSASVILFFFQNCDKAFQTNDKEFLELSSHAPQISVNEMPGLLINERSVSIEFSIVPNPFAKINSTTCKLDEEPPVDCVDKFSVTDLLDGDHNLSIVTMDSFGNTSEEVRVYWRVDATKPVVVLNTSPAAVSGKDTASFTFTGTDNLSGLAALECSVDGSVFAICTSPIELANLTEENHSFKVHAIDVAGNVSDDLTYLWRVDLTAPVIEILTGPTNLSNSTTANFTFTGTDNGALLAEFECDFDNQGFVPCTSPRSYTNLTQGQHAFSLKARDAAGNMTAPVQRAWTIDSVAPTVQIVSSPQNPTNQTSATFQFTPNDGNGSGIARTECSFDGGGFTACVSPKAYNNLANGNRSFSVRAVDNANNVSLVASFNFVVDNVPPQISISASVPASTTSTSASMTISTSDSTSGIDKLECRLDGGAFALCQSPKSYTNLIVGNHAFMARVSDKAGNLSTATFAWTIVSPPPTPTSTPTPTPTPPPPPVGGVPNFPINLSKFNLKVDNDLDPLETSNCHVNSNNIQSVDQPNDPLSPGKGMRMLFPIGTAGGGSPSYYCTVGSKEIFMRFSLRVSDPWDFHPSSVNKIAFLFPGNGGDVYLAMRNNRKLFVANQMPGTPDNQINREQNLSNWTLTLGQWAIIDWYVNSTTGVTRVWADGELIMEHIPGTTSGYTAGMGGDTWIEAKLDPTWGGIGSTKTTNDYYDYGHLIIYGSDGSGTVATTNEPLGFTKLTENPLSANNFDGWRTDSGTLQFVNDANAPVSPTGVLRASYSTSFNSGSAPWALEKALPSNLKDIYYRLNFKLSDNFEGQGSATNKLGFVWTHNSPSFFISAEGVGSGNLIAMARIQDAAESRDHLPPNKGKSGIIQRGVWHTLEVRLINNDPGVSNGTAMVWLDGVLITEYKDVRFTGAGLENTWQYVSIYPIWGGAPGQSPANNMFMDFDHIYVSR